MSVTPTPGQQSVDAAEKAKADAFCQKVDAYVKQVGEVTGPSNSPNPTPDQQKVKELADEGKALLAEGQKLTTEELKDPSQFAKVVDCTANIAKNAPA